MMTYRPHVNYCARGTATSNLCHCTIMYPLSRFKVVFDPLTLLLDIELNLALSSHHIVAAVVKNYEFPFSPSCAGWSSFSNGVLDFKLSSTSL